eukprot:1155208-Pelagomonas_calceolata.AAC.1
MAYPFFNINKFPGATLEGKTNILKSWKSLKACTMPFSATSFAVPGAGAMLQCKGSTRGIMHWLQKRFSLESRLSRDNLAL